MQQFMLNICIVKCLSQLFFCDKTGRVLIFQIKNVLKYVALCKSKTTSCCVSLKHNINVTS